MPHLHVVKQLLFPQKVHRPFSSKTRVLVTFVREVVIRYQPYSYSQGLDSVDNTCSHDIHASAGQADNHVRDI